MQMIENQEELRGALEKVKHLQNTVQEQELEAQRALMQSENTSQQQEAQVESESQFWKQH